jgi:uncharacterized protein (DUF2249 family)
MTQCGCSGNEATTDVRSVAPRDRHPLTFDTFAMLPLGKAFPS